LGIYFYDEPGGRQLDQADYPIVAHAENYSDATDKYVNTFSLWLRNGTHSMAHSFVYPTEYQLFTSDYAFYWYDYQAGYDTVFTEFGNRIGNWNNSRQLNVALCRGAATVQNKSWGVMITWSYDQPPYMESGPELYNDMILAYNNGAKYIIVFDTNANFTENVLQQEHLDAMNRFWQYVQANPRTIGSVSDRTAYVLPEDYAYGFRGPQDRIWGLWPADSLTLNISTSVATLLQTYGKNLDIIYPSQTQESVGYHNIISWNGTEPLPTPTSELQSPLPFYGTTVYLYVIVASILFSAVVAVVFKFRKKNARNQQIKWHFSK
jgi:hypothetical protein